MTHTLKAVVGGKPETMFYRENPTKLHMVFMVCAFRPNILHVIWRVFCKAYFAQQPTCTPKKLTLTLHTYCGFINEIARFFYAVAH